MLRPSSCYDDRHHVTMLQCDISIAFLASHCNVASSPLRLAQSERAMVLLGHHKNVIQLTVVWPAAAGDKLWAAERIFWRGGGQGGGGG